MRRPPLQSVRMPVSIDLLSPVGPRKHGQSLPILRVRRSAGAGLLVGGTAGFSPVGAVAAVVGRGRGASAAADVRTGAARSEQPANNQPAVTHNRQSKR